MKRKCEECNKEFTTNVIKQFVCKECREELVCKKKGCNEPVDCVQERLCGKHYTQLLRDKKRKPIKVICRNCDKEFIKKNKYVKYFCEECDELLKNLKCEVEGCNNKAQSFNNKKCISCNTGRRKPIVEKNCEICNKSFSTNLSKQKYCCKKCKVKADIKSSIKKNNKISLQKRLEIGYKKCEICGKSFLPTRNNKQHCCSKECREEYTYGYRKEYYIKNLKIDENTKRGKSYPQKFVYNTIRSFFTNLKWEYNNRKILKNPDTNRCLEIDIWCKSKKLAIEFDGPQHFKPKYGKKIFDYTIKMDRLKEKLCEERDITLIRISYYDDWTNKEWIIKKIEEALNGIY